MPAAPRHVLAEDDHLWMLGHQVEQRDQRRQTGEQQREAAQVLGVLLNSVFLDLLDQDALRLQRLNHLIDQVPRSGRNGLRPVRLLVLRPSTDLGRLANEFEPDLPKTFRFLTRGLGTRQTTSPDLLSLVLFQPDYIHRLIELGETDAAARADEIDEFILAGAYED